MALHLLRLGAEAHLELEITIIESRDFENPGASGCNMCAGILSSNLIRNLRSLDLEIPPTVVQSEIESYVLHLEGAEVTIQRPDPSRRILTIFRGSGPRRGSSPYPGSFDGWLLEQAQQRGASLRRGRVDRVLPGARPRISLAGEMLEADLVVLATGINSRPPLDPAWGYSPPRSEVMSQDELLLPASLPSSQVHIFFDQPEGLIFGAVIPKGPYANISLLGEGLGSRAVRQFVGSQPLDGRFPGEDALLCGCKPRIAVSSAQGYYHDRMVAVGDAAVTRLYKDGIGSAFYTTRAAAQTALQRGISQRDFAAGYQPMCRRIAADNRYGQLLFRLWAGTRRSSFLRQSWQRVIQAEAGLPPGRQHHTRALWSMFTGDATYRRIFWLLLSPPALLALGGGVLSSLGDRR